MKIRTRKSKGRPMFSGKIEKERSYMTNERTDSEGKIPHKHQNPTDVKHARKKMKKIMLSYGKSTK